MSVAGLLLGIGTGGSLLGIGAGFFNAARMKRAARANYRNELESIESNRQAGMEQIEQFNEQGDSFLSQGNVANAINRTGGASSNLALASSRGNLIKDARRLREKLDIDVKLAKDRAKANLDARSTASASAGMQSFGSLLSLAGRTYGTGHQWGLW